MREKVKHSLIRRLSIIEGQVRALKQLVEREAYCVDILTQSAAVREAIAAVEQEILRNHLNEHVVEQMKTGRVQKAIREMLTLYRLARRR